MNPTLKNALAVIGGIIIGGINNMAVIWISGDIIHPPEGVNLADMESLKANMHLFKPINFLMPFIAHAFGTLVGAYFTAKFAANKNFAMAILVGVFFLIGGITNVIMLPSPMWFAAVDILFAYIPMAWIGYWLASKR